MRSGFEVYTPAARSAARATTGSGGGDGHDTRGRALWEDGDEAPRLPKGDKEWKRDKWNDNEDEVPQTNTPRVAAGTAARRKRQPAGREANESTASTAVDVPSGERYEDISRRVEEEVVAKLARAQMMGMMLKAHREQEQEDRHGGPRGGSGGRRRRGDHHNRDDRNWDRANTSDRDRDPGRERTRGRARGTGGEGGNTATPRQVLRPANDLGRSGGGGSGGRGSVETQSGGARGQVFSPRDHGHHPPAPSPSDHHSGWGAGPGAGAVPSAASAEAQAGRNNTDGNPKATGMLRVPLNKVSGVGRQAGSSGAHSAVEDLGADPDCMTVDEAYLVVGKLERQHKQLLEEVRKEAGLVPTRSGPGDAAPVSGPAAMAAATAATARAGTPPVSAGLSGRLSRVRGALARALGSLVRRDGTLSLRKRLPNRLWMAHYRELEIVQQRLRQLGAIPGTVGGTDGPGKRREQQQHQALRARLFSLIQEAERDLSQMVEVMETQIAQAKEEKQYAATRSVSGRNDASANGRGGDGNVIMDGRLAAARTHDSYPTMLGNLVTPGVRGRGAAGEDGQSAGSGRVDSAIGGEAGSDEDSEEDDDGLSEEARGRQQALQAFLTHLGDLARYRGVHSDPRNSEEGGGVMGWERAELMYRRALRADPSSGKVRDCCSSG